MLKRTMKIQIEGKCEVDGADIKGFAATIDIDDPEKKLHFHQWEIDKEACKEHRKIVREDQAAFEDFAYEVQEEQRADK